MKRIVLVITSFFYLVSCSPHPSIETFSLNTHSYSVPDTDENLIEPVSRCREEHPVVPVLYDTSGIDKEYQQELVKAVFLALQELDQNDFTPDFIDVSKTEFPSATVDRIRSNCSTTLVSLLSDAALSQFTSSYENAIKATVKLSPVLSVFTPRLVSIHSPEFSHVSIFSLQMTRKALSVALLNRVEKVGIKTLIPVLDSGEVSQLEWMNDFIAAMGEQIIKKVTFTNPIFIDDSNHVESFRDSLNKYTHIALPGGYYRNNNVSANGNVGVLLLASKGSNVAVRIAKEKSHVHVGWFSPNILEHEEWAYENKESDVQSSSMKDQDNNAYFGLYTMSFVGSSRWDSPSRRRMLREFTKYTGASPRVLGSALAYDSAALSINKVRREHDRIIQGLTGELVFDSEGYRKVGTFFGASAVPVLASPTVTLLQPSTWILEDLISVTEKVDERFIIKDYQVATSSILTAGELRAIANKTKTDVGCQEQIMNIIAYDPFNQMPYNYYFKGTNLPENLLIPNQHGFGITFLCFHATNGSNDALGQPDLTTTLEIACTPGMRTSEPVQCFRSHVKLRHKRSPGDTLPPTQYQYGFGEPTDYWSKPQNSKWSKPKDDAMSNKFYYSEYSTPYPNIKRLDTSVAAASEATTPAPAPAPTSKLPELRQILKAAKPFVGSCIGSTTGCAMCVLVLGRLPLGAVPAACTGPCFVGTFGSCGSLLGRVFSETTVICTELFRQGYMDPDTFMADAEFGKLMFHQFPETMKGYTLLATPLVEAMKKSSLVTQAVSFIALPWAQHMKYLSGRSHQPSLPGLIVHTLGFPICNLAGHMYSLWICYTPLPTLTILAVTFLSLLYLLKKKKGNKD